MRMTTHGERSPYDLRLAVSVFRAAWASLCVKYNERRAKHSVVLHSIMVLVAAAALGMLLADPEGVEAQSRIDLHWDPNPPCYLLNDGATPQAFWWKITFGTVPDEAVFTVTDPDGIVVHTETFDLTGMTAPVYNPENTMGDAGMGSPAYAHNWSFSPGIKTGTYGAALAFYSNIGGESAAMQRFWIMQRVQVYKYNDLNGNGSDDGEPPLSGWNFTVSGPEDFSGTTDSTGYAIFDSRNPTSPCALGTEAYRDILKSGTYNVTGTLKNGWENTDPGGSAPYQKIFTVPDPAGQTIVVEFGDREPGKPPPPPEESETAGTGRLASLALWIALGAAIVAGAVIFARRRRARS